MGSIALHLIVVLSFNSKSDAVDEQTWDYTQEISITIENVSTPTDNVATTITVKAPRKVSQLPKLSTPPKTWIAEIEDFIFTYGSMQQIEEETRFYSCPHKTLQYTNFGL